MSVRLIVQGHPARQVTDIPCVLCVLLAGMDAMTQYLLFECVDFYMIKKQGMDAEEVCWQGPPTCAACWAGGCFPGDYLQICCMQWH